MFVVLAPLHIIFGKQWQKALHVPIGLINSSFGGTFVEAWMDKIP